jgi:hypothetical protein
MIRPLVTQTFLADAAIPMLGIIFSSPILLWVVPLTVILIDCHSIGVLGSDLSL